MIFSCFYNSNIKDIKYLQKDHGHIFENTIHNYLLTK
jgi:hypothetical protein